MTEELMGAGFFIFFTVPVPVFKSDVPGSGAGGSGDDGYAYIPIKEIPVRDLVMSQLIREDEELIAVFVLAIENMHGKS